MSIVYCHRKTKVHADMIPSAESSGPGKPGEAKTSGPEYPTLALTLAACVRHLYGGTDLG